MEVKLHEYIRDALINFGKEVNTNRQLVNLIDGLKPVYRRVIYTAIQNGSKMSKTASITGNCIAKYHPHGSDSVDAVVSSLVRWGIFEGQGNHGSKMIYGEDISPSASRYTEARVHPKWHAIISKLIEYVPFVESELEGNMEPEYIPTPLPLVLLFGGMGIGFGINSRYPMFTPVSMLDACSNNDPTLLRAPFGLELDIEMSDLEGLWNRGIGKLRYRYSVTRHTLDEGGGALIQGSAELFKPRLEKGFCEELKNGQVYILDQTSDVPRVFVGKIPRVRAITEDDIVEICKELCTYDKVFRLSVSNNGESHIIPLKDWLEYTIANYVELLGKYKSSHLDSLEFDKKVYQWLPTVTEALINNRDLDSDGLAEVTGCELEVVKAILRKSINTLRNTDSTQKINDIERMIKEFSNLDPSVEVVNMVSELDNI